MTADLSAMKRIPLIQRCDTCGEIHKTAEERIYCHSCQLCGAPIRSLKEQYYLASAARLAEERHCRRFIYRLGLVCKHCHSGTRNPQTHLEAWA